VDYDGVVVSELIVVLVCHDGFSFLLRLSLVESVSLGLSDKAKRCQGVGVPLAA